MGKQIVIREANNTDLDDILKVSKSAFINEKEVPLLTMNLLNDETALPLISLLAFDEDKPIGHILFTHAFVGDNVNAVF